MRRITNEEIQEMIAHEPEILFRSFGESEDEPRRWRHTLDVLSLQWASGFAGVVRRRLMSLRGYASKVCARPGRLAGTSARTSINLRCRWTSIVSAISSQIGAGLSVLDAPIRQPAPSDLL